MTKKRQWIKTYCQLCLFACSLILLSSNALSVTEQVRVSTDNDDAEELISDGDMYHDSSDLEMAHDDFAGGLQLIGLRFQGVNIPSGATIDNATIEFKADGNHTRNTRLVIYGEDTGDANGFGNSDYDISARATVATEVDWSPGDWDDNDLYQTPDLAGVIQNIVDRGDWSAGNDMVLMVGPNNGCNNSNCRRRAESHDGDPSAAPLLVVNFTPTALPAVTDAAGSCLSDSLIVVTFASPVDSATMTDPNNYAIDNGATITSIVAQDTTTAILTIDALDATVNYTLTVGAQAVPVRFNGVLGSYWDQRSGAGGSKVQRLAGLFTGNRYYSQDLQIAFNWGSAMPNAFPVGSSNSDDFSIQWESYIVPSQAGIYRFRTRSDDGIRVTLDGSPVITTEWSDHGPRYSPASGDFSLDANGAYLLAVEFYERGGGAVAELEWSRDGGSWETVPMANYSSCPVVAPPAPTADLEFRMDENSWDGTAGDVVDSSVNANNGTSQGGLNTIDPGYLCRGGNFDGADDYIESGDIYAPLSGTSSLSFWIKTTQTGDDTGWRAPGVAGIEESGGADDIFWGWLDASGRIGISVANDFSSKSTVAINDDVYHHVVLTRDATAGTFKIYIDGSLNNSGSIDTGIIGNSFSSIGRIEDTGGSPEYFQGQLDELKVFRSVLSDGDVTALFNETRSCPSAVTPIAHFAFEQDAWSGGGVVIEDYSGNGNEGVSVGNPVSTNDGYVCKGAIIPDNNSYNIIDGIDSLQDVNGTMGNEGTIMLWYRADDGWNDGVDRTLFDASLGNKYFYLAKEGDSRLEFGLEDTADRDFRVQTAGNGIPAATWAHVAVTWDMTADQLFVYVDGSQSATLSYSSNGTLGNMGSIIFGDNSSTYQVAPGNSAKGALDEIRLYDEVLSEVDIAIIMAESHPCDAPTGCSASFPDGISSHSGGDIDFGFQAQLFSSPDGILDANSVTRNGGATSVLTCDFVDCSASGNRVPLLDPGTFPVFNSSQNLNVSNGNTDTLGVDGDEGGGDTYRRVRVRGNGTLNVSALYNEYFLEELRIDSNGVANLRAGDYWIETLNVRSGAVINVVGGGTARLFVENSVSIGSSSLLNSPSANTSGRADALLLYGYNDIATGSNSTLSGIVYSQGDVILNSPSYVFGAITGEDIDLRSGAKVTYDAAAISSIDLGSLCSGTGTCDLGGFAISQPTYGLACPQARARIDIQAMCSDGVTIKEDYAGVIDLSSSENSQSEFYEFSSGGSPINSYSFPAGALGDIDVYLFHKNENPDLKVTADDNVAGIASQASTGTDFRTSGFAVTAPTDFICGGNTLMTLTAIGQDTSGGGSCSQLTGFSGNKGFKAWSDVNIDPSQPGGKDSGLPVDILVDGQPVPDSSPSSNNITLDFTSGVSTFPVSYLDTGEVLNINMVHDDAPYDGSVSLFSPLAASSGRFIVSPDHVEVTADDPLAACSTPLASCTRFAKANAPFAITGRAICSDGASSVAQSYRGTVDLTHQVVAPTTGVAGSLDVTQLVFDGTGSNAGEANEANEKISEVGVFTLTNTPPAYFGQTVSPWVSPNIGRFYPDEFKIDIVDSTFQPSCTSISSFTYMDEPFLFLTAPEVTIEAVNVDGIKTENYEGDFWKLGADLVEDSSCNGTGTIRGFCYADNVAGSTTLLSPSNDQSYGDTSDVGGEVTLTLHDAITDEFIYRRPSASAPATLVSPFDADVELTIDLSDSDSVTGSETLDNIGFSGDTDIGGADMNATNDELLRYGRLNMENAFGPETNSLKVPMVAQYYNGTTFVTNADDSCSTYDAIDMVIDLNLANSGSTSASGNGTVVSGEAPLAQQVILSAPGLTHQGTAGLCSNVDDWLKFDWNEDGLDITDVCDASASPSQGDNPTSVATFGRYRGNDRIIYWREVNN